MSSCCRVPARKWICKPTSLELKAKVPSDSEISRSVHGKKIDELCKEINVTKYDPIGSYKAKITLQVPGNFDTLEKRGGYVVVTGITPTSFGEGKSTTTIGLAQALSSHLDRNTIACIRQPSQGPTFGLKGGAAGGGYSQVWPMDEFNLHLTGDVHAVTAANNLIAASIDARMFHESTQTDEDLFRRLVTKPGSKQLVFAEPQRRRLEKLGIAPTANPEDLTTEQKRMFSRLDIDPDTITVNRVIDTNDRFLRRITVGQSPTEKNFARQTKFDISVASELMAILALATDFEDVCRRVERMVVGFTKTDEKNTIPKPVTCDDLCVAGAVCALIKDAVYPTILQTLEGSPVLVHCGPFANVAHGNSSIIADKLAIELVGPEGFVITEAGFGSDVGFEKFIDIKCRCSKLMPDCAVLVTTVRALKAHGRDVLGDAKVADKVALEEGCVNMDAHITNINKNFNVPVVVAVNKFTGDTDEELNFVKSRAIESGATGCRVTDNWALGGKGALDLANCVIETCANRRKSGDKAKFLYEDGTLSIAEKINLLAKKVYRASGVTIPESVAKKIEFLESSGFGDLPVCIAKTHLSISHDPKMKGAPSDYTFPIVDINVSAGAGFVYARAGEISTMPGLPTRPAFFDISVDPKTLQVDGLF